MFRTRIVRKKTLNIISLIFSEFRILIITANDAEKLARNLAFAITMITLA